MARRRSLRVELIASLAAVLMIAAVSLSLASEWLGRNRQAGAYRSLLESHARGLGSLLAPVLARRAPSPAERPEVEQTLRPSLGAFGIQSIIIYRATGASMEAVAVMGLPVDDLARPAVADAAGTARALNDDRWVIDSLVASGHAQRQALVLRLVARPSLWTESTDWVQLLILAVGVGGFALVLGVGLLELQVLRPLAGLRSAANQVSQGNLEATAPHEGPAELHDVARAFNDMTSALRDRVGELEAARARLVRSEQLAAVGRIAAGVGHEVGNPLAAIVGYVDLILDPRSQPKLDEEHDQLLRRCREQLERIRGTVGQLLDYSRPSTHRAIEVDLVVAAKALVSLLRHEPRCTDVELTVEGDPHVLAIADPTHIDQVLHNLVVNGARAARAEPAAGPARVRIHLTTVAHEVHIDVSDSGHGIAPAVRERLFEPFVTTAPAGRGSGLGLAISQGLVEAMGGTLTLLHAAHPAGHDFAGATFRVTLPRTPPDTIGA